MTREDTQVVRGPKPPARRQIQSWQEAEHNAAAWMRHWGYEDARAQPGGSDGGVDVRSRRALGQVKYQASAVGRPELQRLFGARGRALDMDLLFFTGSSYAATAIEYAAENGVALFVYGLDGTMTAVNAPARRIATAAAPAPVISLTKASPATPAPVLTSAPSPGPAQERRPGTGRIVLGLVLTAVALFVPGSESFDPRPNRALVTLLMGVVPAVLIVSGIREKSRRRYWPTGLALLLVDLPAAWLTNARLWRGDTADVLVPTTFTVLSLTAAILLLLWNTRHAAGPAGKAAS
ncbi:restriction endonuclease [Streptomyces solaniscabiei]|uniref:restriction endonuclease n=1 Tax=Streptomyces solaniscabiei TaxID=2683255 RepID=UPI001CE30888|nr:restriction endonuclease [Streptomyces solaniscabiei]